MTALIEAIYDMVNQNQAVCRVLILENTNSTVLMRMIALAKEDSIAYWRKELPNASETDLEMMYTHLPNGMMHIVVEGYDKYSKDEIIRFVSRVVKASLPLFLIAFTVGILSTFASFIMSSATTITVDFVALYRPNMTGTEKNRYIRIGLVVSAAIIAILAQFLPTVIVLFQWLFAQMLPIIFFLIIGLFWKRNTGLAVATMALTWIVTNVWTFTSLPAVLGMENINMIWIILAITLIMQIIGNLILPGRKGYFRSDDWFESEQFAIYEREKHGLSEVE